MHREEFLDTVRQAGIVGQGGAGFPSHVKYAAPAEIVIANACECEPLLGSDIYLVIHEAESLVRALVALVGHVGAARGIFAIKKKHEPAVRHISPLAQQVGLEVALLEDFYPAGDEHVLVREVTGRTVPPLGLPGTVGAMVTNVGTLHSVAEAMHGRPLTQRLVTVTGDVHQPGIVQAPLGSPVEQCILACGGALQQDYAIIAGGPMMGRCICASSQKEGACDAVISKTSGALIVLPPQHTLIRAMAFDRNSMRRRAQCACIQCRLCTEICPRYLLGHGLEPHRIMLAFAQDAVARPEIIRQALLCCECGACEKIACPMELAPRQINALLKQEWRNLGDTPKPDLALYEGRNFWRQYRKIPTSRLVERLGLGSFKGMPLPYVGALEPDDVRIPMRQHIGAPAVPRCGVGDSVNVGDVVGDIPEGALGARVHASVTGTVLSVDSASIHIRRMP